MKNICLFGGQGTFVAGKGRDLYESESVFRNAIDLVSQVYDYNLTDYLWGPKRISVKTNPSLSHEAIWAVSYGLFQLCKSKKMQFDFLLGHSLGEFIAYCLSGAIDFEDACKLISKRGDLFLENKRNSDSDMVAVIASKSILFSIISEYKQSDRIYAANYNAQNQIVFSMPKELISSFIESCVKLGAERCVPLNVENGCHSKYVKSIEAELNSQIDRISFSDITMPVYSCIDNLIISDKSELKIHMKNHLLAPVKWSNIIEIINENDFVYNLSFSNVAAGLIIQNIRNSKIKAVY